MFASIFKHKDTAGHEAWVTTLDKMRLVDHDGATVDAGELGRLMLCVPKGSAALELADVVTLRDALTEHLSGFPEATNRPVPA